MSEVPEFDQYVECVTGDGVLPVDLGQHSLDSPLTLQILRQGYQHAAQLGRAVTLGGDKIAAIQAAAAGVYHQDVISHEVVGDDPAAIVDALIAVRERPEWRVGLQCVAADAERTAGVYFNPTDGNLYRCVQAHTAQADWRPDLPGLGALWVPFYEPEAGPQPWVQPTGAHDAYNVGDRVTFEGNVWESVINANVWSPTAYPAGWLLVGPA